MDDMGTPSANHPAHKGLGKRTEGQFDNVVDLGKARERLRPEASDEAYKSNKKILWGEDV